MSDINKSGSDVDHGVANLESEKESTSSNIIDNFAEQEKLFEDLGQFKLLNTSKDGTFVVYSYIINSGGNKNGVLNQFKNRGGDVKGALVTTSGGVQYNKNTRFPKGKKVYVKAKIEEDRKVTIHEVVDEGELLQLERWLAMLKQKKPKVSLGYFWGSGVDGVTNYKKMPKAEFDETYDNLLIRHTYRDDQLEARKLGLDIVNELCRLKQYHYKKQKR